MSTACLRTLQCAFLILKFDGFYSLYDYYCEKNLRSWKLRDLLKKLLVNQFPVT